MVLTDSFTRLDAPVLARTRPGSRTPIPGASVFVHHSEGFVLRHRRVPVLKGVWCYWCGERKQIVVEKTLGEIDWVFRRHP